eukprot:scaffold2552_cov20-Tisochrysis_lutea.AAC.1
MYTHEHTHTHTYTHHAVQELVNGGVTGVLLGPCCLSGPGMGPYGRSPLSLMAPDPQFAQGGTLAAAAELKRVSSIQFSSWALGCLSGTGAMLGIRQGPCSFTITFSFFDAAALRPFAPPPLPSSTLSLVMCQMYRASYHRRAQALHARATLPFIKVQGYSAIGADDGCTALESGAIRSCASLDGETIESGAIADSGPVHAFGSGNH